MAITIPYDFSNGTAANATEVNANFDAVESAINSGGIDASSLASNAVTTAKILDANVTTAKLVDASVTQAKLAARTTGTTVAAGGVAVSTSSGSFSTTSTTAVDITNLTVTITTTGRPVKLELTSAVTGTSSYVYADDDASLIFDRGGATLTSLQFTGEVGDVRFPLGAFNYLDLVAAGTYTYKARLLVASGGTVAVNSIKLVAYEI